MAEEGMSNTKHEKIYIGAPYDINFKILKSNLEKLMDMIPEATDEEIKDRLTVLVPTYKRLDVHTSSQVSSAEDVAKFKENKRYIDAQILKDSQLAREGVRIGKMKRIPVDDFSANVSENMI